MTALFSCGPSDNSYYFGDTKNPDDDDDDDDHYSLDLSRLKTKDSHMGCKNTCVALLKFFVCPFQLANQHCTLELSFIVVYVDNRHPVCVSLPQF